DVQVRVAGRISEFAGEGAALIVEHVGDQHLAAAVDDLPGERSPQATRPTGDEDDLVGEYCFLHRGLLPGACGASCGQIGRASCRERVQVWLQGRAWTVNGGQIDVE